MIEIQPLHNMLINSKKGVPAILQVLPHFRSYNGAMVRNLCKIFLFRFAKNSAMSKICLIMGRLSRKGVKKLPVVMPLEVEEELASPLIRFIPDSPSALAEQLAIYAAYDIENFQKVPPHLINQGESFMIYAEGQIILLGTCSVQAIDTFVKFFNVFNYKVPSSLVKLVELIEIISYKCCTFIPQQPIAHPSAILLPVGRNFPAIANRPEADRSAITSVRGGSGPPRGQDPHAGSSSKPARHSNRYRIDV
ncbi:uncharacterized protein LOC135713639 [Ochlerotatus camptorhynchus]|uniref:uncharacterized protein LOC135713639 n=1 Tax=Ochlerotatus camptorhynchus TaxID=644619 RepID=UPI0031D2F159